MKKFIHPSKAIAIVLLSFLIVFSCKKTEVLSVSKTLTTVKNADYKKGDFAFSVSNLRKITRPRSVTTTGTGDVIPSHLYVRFKPVTQNDINAIEAANIPTYPYPLATDSLDVSNPDYTKLYTFLPIAKSLPNCPYEILDTVMLLDPESSGAMQAYIAAGANSSMVAGSTPRSIAPAYSLQPLPCDPWNDDVVPVNCIDCDCGINPPPPPPPPPATVTLGPADARPTPATVTYNSCSMNTDDNYPSGRITVEETQWGTAANPAYEGVADVKVEILGPMGQRVVTQTNRYGCFKATSGIWGFKPLIGPRLPVILSVLFISGRKEIRGLNGISIAQYAMPLRHTYGNISYNMNQVNISYERHIALDYDLTKYFVAATVNNALYEYDEYAAKDGILPPPDDLKILVHRYSSSSSTPMTNAMNEFDPVSQLLIQGLLHHNNIGFGTLLETLPIPPDIFFGYNWTTSMYTSDQIREIAYHEFAHASHYRITTRELWRENINNVIHNNGYGSIGDPGVELTDLIEMWGYFLGREYTHRRYGPNAHSELTEYFTNSGTPTFLNSWYAVNEITRFDFEHIPSGFLHDIIDDNAYNHNNNLNDSPTNIPDHIKNYTISTIFNNMGANTTSALDLINRMRMVLPTDPLNTIVNYDSLMHAYNY